MITTVTLNTSVDKLYLVEKLEDYTVMRVKTVSYTHLTLPTNREV